MPGRSEASYSTPGNSRRIPFMVTVLALSIPHTTLQSLQLYLYTTLCGCEARTMFFHLLKTLAFPLLTPLPTLQCSDLPSSQYYCNCRSHVSDIAALSIVPLSSLLKAILNHYMPVSRELPQAISSPPISTCVFDDMSQGSGHP